MYQRTWTLGLEAQEEDTLEALEPIITEEPSESVEATDLEVNEANDDLEATDRQAEDLADDISDLQTVHDVVADSLSDGGCEVSNARLIDVATESFCARWDIPRAAVACEAMAYATPSVRANVACEGIMDTIKAGIKKLIEFINNVILKIKTFFGSVVDYPSKILKRAEALEKVANERANNEFNRKKWSVGSWANNVSVGGEYNPKQIFNQPGRIIQTSEYIFEDLVILANNIVDKVDATNAKSTLARMKMRFFGNATLPKQARDKLSPSAKDARVVAFPGELYLIGERYVSTAGDAPDKQLTTDDFKLSYIVAETSHQRQELTPPSHDEIVKAINASKEFANGLQQHIDGNQDVNKSLELMQRGLDVLTKSIASAANSLEHDGWVSLYAQRKQEMSNFKIMVQVNILGLRNAALGMLSYAEAGLRCYA